jgi:hypothetical protein
MIDGTNIYAVIILTISIGHRNVRLELPLPHDADTKHNVKSRDDAVNDNDGATVTYAPLDDGMDPIVDPIICSIHKRGSAGE